MLFLPNLPNEASVAVNFYRLCIITSAIIASILCVCGVYLHIFGNAFAGSVLLAPGLFLFILIWMTIFTVRRIRPAADGPIYYNFRRDPNFKR